MSDAGSGIHVVLFDLDDTLFAHRESVEAGITAHRAALGGPLAAADAASEATRWHDLEEHHYHRYLRGETDYAGQRHARARDFVAPFGIELDDQQADDWFVTYSTQYRRAWTLHPDAAACVETLEERGVRLGVITNGELEFQLRKIRALGLEPRFEHVIASGEIGAAKPDPEIFRRACVAFDVPPAEACYVGDRLHTDAIGAESAGLLGVWLDRHATATADDLAQAAASGVPVIRTLAELPPLVT